MTMVLYSINYRECLQAQYIQTMLTKYIFFSTVVLWTVMNSEREILLNSVAAIINMQPTNDIFLRIMTSRDITVVKSLAKFIYGCFKKN